MEILARVVNGKLHHRDRWPGWLQRSGKTECGSHWGTVGTIYSKLTNGLTLPDVMPRREYRSIDRVIESPEGQWRIVEFDESQHFNPFRATTLRHYPVGAVVAFPMNTWLGESAGRQKLRGGGFAKTKSPLFPAVDGRHRQRAFRDTLTDLLPSLYGFSPTLRIADFEVLPWIYSDEAEVKLRSLIHARLAMPDRVSATADVTNVGDSGHARQGAHNP